LTVSCICLNADNKTAWPFYWTLKDTLSGKSHVVKAGKTYQGAVTRTLIAAEDSASPTSSIFSPLSKNFSISD